MKSEDWFSKWFDSPYYHILYQHHDIQDAKRLIDHLISYFKIRSTDRILDLACGKGRHSVYLNQKGYNVVGIDLSAQNIQHASLLANDQLLFLKHDMRYPLFINTFNYVFNLFTSFGYFEKEEENIQVLQSAHQALRENGKLVIDFFNPLKISKNVIAQEKKILQGIEFLITKKIEQSFIIKTIDVTDGMQNYHFSEKVQLITQADFENYLKQSSFKLLEFMGYYALEPYHPETSDRLIVIAEKI